VAEIANITPEDMRAAQGRALVAAARFRLPFRTLSWRGSSGGFAGTGTGSSLDFHDHRSYLPGDDPRHINWQAFARTGSYTMKLFREEVRPLVDVVIDASASMWFDRAKALRSAELLYLLVEGAVAVGAAVSVRAVSGPTGMQLSPDEISSHRWFPRVVELAENHLQPVPEWHRLPLRTGAIRAVVSDLLFSEDPDLMLGQISRLRGATVLLAPFSAAEAHPDWSGNYDFIDAESGQIHPLRVGPAEHRRYLEAYAAHVAAWKSAAIRHRIPMARVPAEIELAPALHLEAIPFGVFETTQD
jgi:uncharacterized protein (DUF58 family)